MKTAFFVWFFLINGQWQVGDAPYHFKEVAVDANETLDQEKKMAICEIGKAMAQQVNADIQKKPEGTQIQGKTVHGIHIECFPVNFPQ